MQEYHSKSTRLPWIIQVYFKLQVVSLFPFIFTGKMDPVLEPYNVHMTNKENEEQLQAQNQRISNLGKTYRNYQLELQKINDRLQITK